METIDDLKRMAAELRKGLPRRRRRARQPSGGDVLTYGGVHQRLIRVRGSAWGWCCVDCGRGADEWSYAGGDPAELIDERGRPYSLDLGRYVPRCIPCHRRRDARPSRRETT